MKTFKLLNIIQNLFILLVGLYITAKLTFGNKGILEYYKLEEKFNSNKTSVLFIAKENKKLETKLGLLNENSVNLLYLKELARKSLNFGTEYEKLIILEDAKI